MRKTFYKMELIFENGTKLPITIATSDINNLQPLVEKNRMLYTSMQQSTLVGHPITDTRYTFDMPEEAYTEDLQFCDIVDD